MINKKIFIFYDILGVLRQEVGFSKTLDQYDNHLMEVGYYLKPIDLNYLRKIFDADIDDPDLVVRVIIAPLNIDEKQAKLLQSYAIEKAMDLDKYFFELHSKKKSISVELKMLNYL